MNRSPWIVLAYGYVVCLVAVITLIVNVDRFVDAAFDRAHPAQSREFMFAAPFSVGGTRQTVSFGPGQPPPASSTVSARSDSSSPAEQRKQYEAWRAERLEQATYLATKQLVKSALMILLAIALFVWHWRWLQRQREPAAAVA